MPFPDQVIRPTGIAGIDLVPGSRHATEFNVPLPHRRPPEAQSCLREFLAEVRDGYDLVLIDCPPNLHLCSWAALVASDYLVVPLQPEDYGAQGIIEVQESVQLVRSGPNPRLRLLGYLLTLMNARKTRPPDVRGAAARAVRGPRLRDPGARGGRVRRGIEPPQAGRPVQAEGRGGEGDEGAGRGDARTGWCTVHRPPQEAA